MRPRPPKWCLILAVALGLPAGVAAQERPTLGLGFSLADGERAAAAAPNAVAAAYRDLTRPYDELTLSGGKTIRVAPVGVFLGDPPKLPDRLSVRELDKDGRPGEPLTLTPRDVEQWRPFEGVALARVQALLGDKEISPAEALPAAQDLLVGVLRFHQEGRADPEQEPNPWLELRTQLGVLLAKVRVDYLDELVRRAGADGGWADALAHARRLGEVYADRPLLRGKALAVQAQYAEAMLKAGNDRVAAGVLADLQRQAPRHPRTEALRKQVEDAARKLAAAAGGDPARIRQALALWPQLPGGRDRLLKAQGGYAPLRVAVPALPEQMSPATAVTDAERLAVDLLFEGLLRREYDDKLGESFGPGLAEGVYQADAGSLTFALAPDASWSDGGRVTAADVRDTVELLRSPRLPGRVPLWGAVVDPPRIGNDPRRVEFTLRGDTFRPLWPFTFPVLPRTYQGKPLPAADDPAFARAPVGSGPFAFRGRRDEGGRPTAVFTANPYYARAGREPLPHVREIHFQVPADPVAAFLDQDSPVHVLTGLTPEQTARLRSRSPEAVRVLPGLRVCFLALNHRRPALQNEDLRQALAAAVNRDELLDVCFRGKDPAYRQLPLAGAGLGLAGASLPDAALDAHAPANGPFPPGSWACAPPSRVPVNLYDPERARTHFQQAKGKMAEVKLTLKHPDDDPPAAAACRLMADAMREAAAAAGLKLTVDPVPLPPRQMREALWQRDYDLAYAHRDHDSEFYWLWPLFDPGPEALAPGGSNVLGYDNDATLVGLLRGRLGQPEFRLLRELSQEIHHHLYERMPLIPLWRLDTVVALHPSVRPGDLGAPRLFADIAHWKLQAP